MKIERSFFVVRDRYKIGFGLARYKIFQNLSLLNIEKYLTNKLRGENVINKFVAADD